MLCKLVWRLTLCLLFSLKFYWCQPTCTWMCVCVPLALWKMIGEPFKPWAADTERYFSTLTYSSPLVWQVCAIICTWATLTLRHFMKLISVMCFILATAFIFFVQITRSIQLSIVLKWSLQSRDPSGFGTNEHIVWWDAFTIAFLCVFVRFMSVCAIQVKGRFALPVR